MTGYTDIIRKYASDNSRTGLLDPADGIGEVGLTSTEVGRKLAVRFTLKVDQNRIKRARYQVFGCGFTISACAVAAELAEGEPLASIDALNAAVIDRRLGGLPAERSYCADLAVEALQAAVSSLSKSGENIAATHSPLAGEHTSLITSSDPIYRALINSPKPPHASHSSRHLFACLIAVAELEPTPLHQALGLTASQLETVFETLFPGIDRQAIFNLAGKKATVPPATNPDIHTLLRSYLSPTGDALKDRLADLLTQIITARAAHPGHLWIAMGLFERSQLSMAIGLYLPQLLKANDQGMRWKRFMFKQLCDQSGGVMCKSPNCRDCSDYAICFE